MEMGPNDYKWQNYFEEKKIFRAGASAIQIWNIDKLDQIEFYKKN